MDVARAIPILVQFGIGAVLSAIGVWCGVRSGYVDLGVKSDRNAVILIVAGFVALLALYCLFTFVTPNIPAEPAV